MTCERPASTEGARTRAGGRPDARWSASGVAALLLTMAGLACSCSDETLTQLVVVVDSDLPPGAFDALRLDVIAPSGGRSSATLDVGSARPLPATLSLVHSGGALGPIEITATALRGGDEVVSRTVRTGFVAGETRQVTLHLLGRCVEERCGEGLSCGESGCASPDKPAETLPRWNGAVPPALRPAAPVDGGAPDADATPPIDGGGDGGPPADAEPDAPVADAAVDAGPACPLRHPPPRPAVAPDPAGFQRFFAVQRMELGVGTPGAWRDIGLDLDDRCTSSDTPLEELECETRIGAGHPDGEEGIDNQFGASIINALTVGDPDLLSDFNTSFARGIYGLVLTVSGWNLTPEDDAVSVALLEADSGHGPLGGVPEHIGEDVWTVSTDSLIDGDLERPLCAGTGYVTGGVVVAQLPSRCGFRLLSADDNVIDVRLSRPLVMATISPTAPSFGSGLLVGRWRVDDFVGSFDQISGILCPGPARMALMRAADASADVLAEDPPDPAIPCDAISFGARFRGNPATVSPVVGPAFTPIDYCP